MGKKKDQKKDDPSLIQVKCRFECEFRRFSLPRPRCVVIIDSDDRNGETKKNKCKHDDEDEEQDAPCCWSFQAFRVLLRKLYRLPEKIPFAITYIDPKDGDLLPINNNENFRFALIAAGRILRVCVGLEDDDLRRDAIIGDYHHNVTTSGVSPAIRCTQLFFPVAGAGYGGISEKKEPISGSYHPAAIVSIGRPANFRHVSALIDEPDLPTNHRKVRIRKSPQDGRPLGFFVKDGLTVRNTEDDSPMRVPGVFVSRLVAGGLAESTGVLLVNDEILEVNGIFVADGSKNLDQVIDILTANMDDLILIVRAAPADGEDVNPQLLPSTLPPRSRSNTGTTTVNGTINGKTSTLKNAKRKMLASSVFYLNECDYEDKVISFLPTKQSG